MTRERQNVELYTGDDRNFHVTIYDSETGTTPKNLTGANATYSVRDKPGGALLFAAKTITPGPGITLSGTPTDGTLTIRINSSDTSGVALAGQGGYRQDFYHELEITIGGIITTAFVGRFRLNKSVSGAGA